MNNEILDVKLSNFEGPLDLLIHLIYRNEMNIYDISISLITDQFIATINEMEKMSIEIASEFIQMASYLVYLKSKMLLPKSSNVDEELDPEEEKFIFTQRLIEYSFYKDIASILKEKEEKTGFFLKRQESFYLPKTELQVEDAHKLSSLFFEIINKDKTDKVVLEKNTLDLNLVIEKIKSNVDENNEIFWSEIVKFCKTKREMAVSMLAILELIKLKVVMAFQNQNFDDILVKKYES